MTKPDLMAELAAAMWRIETKDRDYAAMMAVGFLRTHHAELEAVVRKASMYDSLRDADLDSGQPYIARERQDSWGNWKTEWLGGIDADRAIDQAMHNSAREG